MRVVSVTEVRVVLVTVRNGSNAKTDKVGALRRVQPRYFPEKGMRLLDREAKDA